MRAILWTEQAQTDLAAIHAFIGQDSSRAVDTGGNSAGFRFQLPVNWNRKLLFYGVWGTGGSVLPPSANAVDRASALVKGYATAVTQDAGTWKIRRTSGTPARPQPK